MKKSTKLNIYVSAAVSVAMPAIMLYELMPGADAVQAMWFVCSSVGAWIAVGLFVFVMNWVLFGGLFLLGRWIHEKFYRTPTL